MRNPGGYAFIVSPDASFMRLDDRRAKREIVNSGTTELDSFTCFHCNSVKHVRAKERPEDLGGLCKQCMKLICSSCVDGGCTPFEKKLEKIEARSRALRSYGI